MLTSTYKLDFASNYLLWSVCSQRRHVWQIPPDSRLPSHRMSPGGVGGVEVQLTPANVMLYIDSCLPLKLLSSKTIKEHRTHPLTFQTRRPVVNKFPTSIWETNSSVPRKLVKVSLEVEVWGGAIVAHIVVKLNWRSRPVRHQVVFGRGLEMDISIFKNFQWFFLKPT